ncbi:MAG: thioredoxin [Methanomicrobiaceae archaeon]|nr:thioredoxin [Methanomicrobiaceae archaeon]
MSDEGFFDEDSSFDDELSQLRQKRIADLENRFLKSDNCGGVIAVGEDSFLDFIGSSRYAVLDMWAEWCGPCRMVAPVIEELSSELSGQVAFGKCNTDENPNLSRKFMISAIPTLLFFSGGQLADRLTGAYPKESIEKRIKLAFSL